MAEATIVKTKRDGTIKIQDSGGTNSYTVAYEAGDLNITIPGPAVNVFLDRGRFGSTPSVRFGDDQPITFTFSAYLRDTTDAAAASLNDVIQKTGWVASNWVPVNGALASTEVKLWDIVFTIEGNDHGEAADQTITIRNCWLTGNIAEGDPSTISVSGTAFDLYPEFS